MDKVPETHSTLTLFVLIDALGWPYVQDFMREALPVRKPLRTVLGYSSGAIPTILTGVLPVRTGHWNLFYYNPEASRFRWLRRFAFLPELVLDNRITRKLLKEMGRRILGLGPLFECCVKPQFLPYFDWIEKRNIYAPGGIMGASSIFDHLVAEGIPYRAYSYHLGSDSQLIESMRRDLQGRRASFYFLYLSEIDGFLHHHCKEPDEIRAKLSTYADQLTGLFRLAQEIDPRVRIGIASDHGMTPIREHENLAEKLQRLDLRIPDDYLVVFDSTMIRFWFFSQRAKETILHLLAGEHCGRLLPDSELRELGILFDDRRFGEAIFLLNPGCMLASSDFNGAGWNPVGMHGYHPDDAYSDGIFLGNTDLGCSLKTIADLYSWMRAASVQAT